MLSALTSNAAPNFDVFSFSLREARTALMCFFILAEKIQGSKQLHHRRLPTFRATPRDPSRHRPPRHDGHREAVVFQRDMHLLKLHKVTRKDLNAAAHVMLT